MGALGRRSAAVAVVLLLSAIAVSGCERNGPAPRDGSEPRPLRLGLAEQPSSALVIVALARGLFAEQGVPVVVTRYPSGRRALLDGLVPGREDLVTAAAAATVKLGLDEVPVKIVASIFSADNVNQVVARRDAGIAVPADLAGKRIATQKGSAVHFFWHLFSLEHGIHNAARPRFLPAEDLPRALAEGRIDAFSMREPYVSEARSLLGDNALVFEGPGLYEQRELLVVAGPVAAERGDAVQAVLRALLAAETYANAHPNAARSLIASELGVPQSRIDFVGPNARLRVGLDQSLLMLLEEQAGWYITAGLKPKGAMPNFLDLVDPGPLDAVAPESVTLIR